jgi:hypothetical protein
MNTESESKPKKRLPYWAVLLIGVIVTGVVANLLSTMLQIGGLTTWKSLSKPPSQAIHIIYTDSNVVWVKTKNSEIFELTVNCYRENCFQWLKTTEDLPGPSAGTFLSRGTNCASLSTEVFPISPSEKVVECVKVVQSGGEFGSVAYFALMADGTLQYWANGNSIIAMQVLFVFATFILPFFAAVLISAVYLIKNFIKRVRAGATLKAGYTAPLAC